MKLCFFNAYKKCSIKKNKNRHMRPYFDPEHNRFSDYTKIQLLHGFISIPTRQRYNYDKDK